MNDKQFDFLIKEIRTLQRQMYLLTESVSKQNTLLDSIQSKTVVVSDIGNQIEQLQVEIKSLKDEKEM